MQIQLSSGEKIHNTFLKAEESKSVIEPARFIWKRQSVYTLAQADVTKIVVLKSYSSF